jgi:hypothetical protein
LSVFLSITPPAALTVLVTGGRLPVPCGDQEWLPEEVGEGGTPGSVGLGHLINGGEVDADVGARLANLSCYTATDHLRFAVVVVALLA